MSTIVYILIAFVIIIILLYYYWYIDTDDNDDKDIPTGFLHEDDTTVVDLFKNISKKYGRYPALKKKHNGQWTTITYSDYYKFSLDLAERFLYFVGPHPRVAILSFNRPEWFYVHMATMMANGMSIGIYPTASTDNCSYITNHSHVDLLVVEDMKQLVKFTDIKMPTVKMIIVFNCSTVDDSEISYDIICEQIRSVNPNLEIIAYEQFIDQNMGNHTTTTSVEITREPLPDDTATIIYTSGTTSDPKGVVITHKNIINTIKSGLNAIQSRSNITVHIQERFISYLPLNHVAAQLMDIYVPLASVGVVHFINTDDASTSNGKKTDIKDALSDVIKEVRPSIFISVPRIWEKIMEKIKDKQQDPQRLMNKLFVNKMIVKEIGLDKCKYCITAAAPVSASVKTFFSDLGIELCDVYGMSETTGPISMAVPGSSKGSGVPIMDIKIDKYTNEICVRGDSVFKEYYKDAQETTTAFIKKRKHTHGCWFKTGDTGYIDRDGSLYVTGRIKDLIITAGGENIPPVPIEELLLTILNDDDKYFEHVVVIGDERKFLSVLLFPTKKYKSKSSADMTKLIEAAIKKTNGSASNSVCTIKKFTVLKGEYLTSGLTIEDCLTPTFKIRRKIISNKYKNKIDKMYDESV